MNNMIDKNSILENVIGEARDGYADFLRERTKEVSASPQDFSKDTKKEGDYGLENKVTLEKAQKMEQEQGDSSLPIETEAIESIEKEKLDKLMEAVDKFETLAEETKKIEKELQEAQKAREEHYGSYAGKITSADQNQERGFVALKAEVGQKIIEMVALKGDILDKLSQLDDGELREKVYQRFLTEKPDLVGMSSEVLLETKSARHEEDLKQRALHHRAIKIIEPNLKRIAKKKELAGANANQLERSGVDELRADDNIEEEASQKAAMTEEENNSQILPGIKMGMGEDEEEASTESPAAVSTSAQPKVKEEPSIVSLKPTVEEPEAKPEPMPASKSELEAETHPPVELMLIDSEGNPTSITDSIGKFEEDSITADAALEPSKPKLADSIVDRVQADKEAIAKRIGLELRKPAEPTRRMDSLIPSAPEVDQAAEPVKVNPISVKPIDRNKEVSNVENTPVIPEKSGIPAYRQAGKIVNLPVDSQLEFTPNSIRGGNDNAEIRGDDEPNIAPSVAPEPKTISPVNLEPAAGQPETQNTVTTSELGNGQNNQVLEASANVNEPIIKTGPTIVPEPNETNNQKRGLFSWFSRGKSDGIVPSDKEGLVKHIVRKGSDLTTADIPNMIDSESLGESEQIQKAA
jgi:hypothetical protein